MDNEARPQFDDRLERELDALFAAYRAACPEPEPSVNFMPELWQKIEAQRTITHSFTSLTRAFLTAAAAICVLLILLQTTLNKQPAFYTQTYVEALADASAEDSPLYNEASLYTSTGGGIYQ
jgi:hypothetical protein